MSDVVCCWCEVLFVANLQCVAFHDIRPQAPIHFIVIPKRPIGQICDCDDADKQVIFLVTLIVLYCSVDVVVLCIRI